MTHFYFCCTATIATISLVALTYVLLFTIIPLSLLQCIRDKNKTNLINFHSSLSPPKSKLYIKFSQVIYPPPNGLRVLYFLPFNFSQFYFL